jgi:heme-binding NEAT domain protein
MSESIAGHRARYPHHRVMLIVGGFHVASDGGTQVKLRRRRPKDAVLTIIYHGASTTPLKFDDADKGSGDIVIYGVKPPEDEEKPAKPSPTSAPTTAPTSMPTPTTQAM